MGEFLIEEVLLVEAPIEFVFDRLAGTPIPAEKEQGDMLDMFMARLRAHYQGHNQQ